MLRQRLDEMGDSVIMSQVGGAADAAGSYRWRVHVHVLDAEPAVALIRSLGEPTDISVSELAVPRDPEPQAAAVAAFEPPQLPPKHETPTDMNAELELGLERRIGKRSAAVIEKHLGITTVGGLLNYFPRRYLSRGELTPISEVPLDEEVTLIARVVSNSTRPDARPARFHHRRRDFRRRREPGNREPNTSRHAQDQLLQRIPGQGGAPAGPARHVFRQGHPLRRHPSA